MIIKSCSKCSGRPYTTNTDMLTCPYCSERLSVELVSLEDLCDRKEISATGNYSEQDHTEQDNQNTTGWGSVPPVPPVSYDNNSSKTENAPDNNHDANLVCKHDNTIRGRISQYSCTGREDGNYRRLFFVRWFQALVYRQRLEDTLHRFTVRVEDEKDSSGYSNYRDVPVNVHGTISRGLQLADNMEVEVSGKYNNGVLMASSVHIVNNGYKSKVNFQRSVRAIVSGIVFVLMLLFLCFIGSSSGLGFWIGIGTFLKLWGIYAVVLTVLYLVLAFTRIGIMFTMFRGREARFPIMGILIISMILAVLSLYAFAPYL